MQSLKKWIKYNLAHTQARLVLILTFSVFLIILAVSMTSYYTSKSVLQEELSGPQLQMLQLNMSVIDESIKESDQVAIQVGLNKSVYQFFTSADQNSIANITDMYQLLSTLISNSKYVKSIYIYDIQKGSFVAIPQGYSSSKLNFIDSEWIGVEKEFGDKMTVIQKRDVPEGAGRNASDVTLFRKIMIQGEFRGIVAVNLKDEELFAKLSPPSINNVSRIRFIIDTQDDVLYSSSNYDFDREAIREALTVLKEEGSGDLTYHNRKLLVNQLESPVTGWKYVSIVEQDSLLAKSKKVRDTVLLVSIAALAVGGATIFYINAAAFRPVRRLKQLFSVYDRKGVAGAEGINLEKLAGELVSNHAHLSQLVRETMSEAASKLLYDIYTANLTGKRDIQEKWSRYFTQWSSAPIQVAILSIDRYEAWSRTYTDADRSLMKFALANIVAELFEPQWRIVCADFGKDQTAILLQSREDIPMAKAKERLERKLAEAIQVVFHLLKFSVSAGISTPLTEMTRLRQAMLEAENALAYRVYQGYGQIILFEKVSAHEVGEPLPSEQLLEELTLAIKAGDESAAQGTLNEVFERLRKQDAYPSTVVSFLEAVAERVDQLRPAEETDAEPIVEQFDTLRLEDIQEELQRRVTALVHRFYRLAQSKDFIMCQQMIDYMQQRLDEPIGIPEIAESIGISSSLASQVFKQETGETIYNYLTQLRMERAAELLLKTDARISDIAAMVGYQHENSFIRSFRKFKDITPGKYRDVMKTRIDSPLE
ncbi:helix-turn-helix domain-containing protein [Paenibacillus silviterrae]|uniref:helix-turn-helix domain-containing protein n=1 Tax=Paenibacillus silviterrae TaxID=3242194 RepID=UPI002542E267|nr:helix-turn-helix domain-containing protein [Paenibacillus chinjuensis]